MGKGRKERLVFLDRTAWTALSDYLKGRGSSGTGLKTPLFCRHLKSNAGAEARLSTWGARKIVRGYVQEAELRIRVTPHKRHSFATLVLESTGDLAATQDLMGHASPTTTRIFAALVPDQLRKAHMKAFPD